MRRLLALGCCAVYLAFGFVAGAAHLHEAADHHQEMRGLHLDHSHLGEALHVPHENGNAGDETRHVGHHDGDAFYLTVTALRSFDSGLRMMPATVSVGATIDPPSLISIRRDERSDQLRGPPRRGPTSPRAPPA